MQSSREIRSKIISIKKTQKITRAMRMVAVSKMRKAEMRREASRPYFEKMNAVITHLASAHPEYRHPYLNARETKRIGLIIITTDRGLCGALNVSLLRLVADKLIHWQDEKKEHDLCLVGNKADAFFRRFGANIIAKGHHINEKSGVKDLIGIVKVMLDRFDANQIDALYIAYNRFVNTMSQVPCVEKLLPIVSENSESKRHFDYLYEPNARILLEKLLMRYVESQVYQATVENIASEQAARMMAMMSATENAQELITKLQLDYNKVRQAMITREIAEIVGGAEAIGGS